MIAIPNSLEVMAVLRFKLYLIDIYYNSLHTGCQTSVQKILELFAAARMSKLTKRLRLNLADTFTGNVKLLAHFLQRAGTAVLQSKTQPQHFLFPISQRRPVSYTHLDVYKRQAKDRTNDSFGVTNAVL